MMITEQATPLLAWLRDYAQSSVNSLLWDERRCIPPALVLDFGNRGLLGLMVEPRHGGLGLDARSTAQLLQQLAAIDLSLAIFVGIHNLLGIRPLLQFGQSSLQAELLPLLASGRSLGALALTERGAGSNPHQIATQAVWDGANFVVSGDKIWIGNGSWAGAINVFARCPPTPERRRGMLAFVARPGMKGFRHGPEALTMGLRAMVQSELSLCELRVPDDCILGEAGSGFAVAEDAFGEARLGLAACSLGCIQRALQLMLRYSSKRKVATGLLGHNASVLRRMSELTMAAECLDALLDAALDVRIARGQLPWALSLVCKAVGPELAWKAADDLVQVLGGRGYIETNIASQMFRDVRILRIFEGATETLHYHLGSSLAAGLLDPAALLFEYFSESPAGPWAAAALDEVTALSAESPSPLLSQSIALAHGGIFSAACIWAAMHRRCARSSSEPARRALAWAQANAQDVKRRAVGDVLQAPSLDAPLLGAVVSDYEQSIGDIEQQLCGVDLSLDPLLRRRAA